MLRRGDLEECYFNFTFSPVRGENGAIDGIFNAVVETTDRVLSERQLLTLNRMGERTDPSSSIEATCRKALESLAENRADVPFALVYLKDDDAPSARLVACASVEAGGDSAPEVIALDSGAPSAWPLAEAHEKDESVVIASPANLALPTGVSTADMLIELGYKVVEASSAEEALRLLNQGLNPEILVTDHLMPGMNGTELALVFQRERPSTTALLVSGYAETAGIAPDLPRLTKPFRSDELATVLVSLRNG